jgi:preprotein translocase subunit YajC
VAYVLPILLIVALYFFFITPQRRRAQAQKAAQTSIEPGDRVVMAGGLIGTLHHIDSQRAVVELAPGVYIEALAQAVLRVVNPATDGVDEEDQEPSPAIVTQSPTGPIPEVVEDAPPADQSPAPSDPPWPTAPPNEPAGSGGDVGSETDLS